MPNPLARAWDYLRANDLNPKVEQKFSPADPSQNWQYVQHLITTANTRPWALDGQMDGNSAVFACLMALSLASIEPPLKVYRQTAPGKRDELPDHPLQALLDDPNPELDMLEIRFWISWARHVDGNAYLVKMRDTAGAPFELWPVSPTRLKPFTERDSSRFIDYYKYQRADGDYERIDKNDVIHFKLGTDDRDHRMGLSPIKRLVREVASDTEATKFADALLSNFGVPGLVVTLPENTTLPVETINTIKNNTKEAFYGENRGRVAVAAGGATMQQFGFSPEQLNLKILHDFPETRICAVMGVDPLVARLGVGLEQTSNYASARQVRENFTENTIKPLWKFDEAKWNKRLRPELEPNAKVVIAYDLTEVSALQEDMTAVYARLTAAVKEGWVLPDEARSEVGLPPLPDGVGMQPKPAPLPAPAPGGPSPNQNRPAPAGEKSFLLDDWDHIGQVIIEEAAPLFADDIQRLMDSQKRRVQRALTSGNL